jgi:outer membrane protein assembly factor BamB
VKDGSPVWSTRIGKVGNPTQQPNYPAARSTPTVDADVLYALGSDGDLVCLSISDGKEKWHKNLRSDFGGIPGRWAYAESPLIDGDLLVCTPGGAQATIVALNKTNGEVIWKSAVPGGDAAGYASLIIVDVDGIKQYVQFLEKGLVGVDAKSGKFLWRYEQTAKGSPANIPTPVGSGPYVYSGAARSGGGLVKLTAHNGSVSAEPVYFNNKLPSAIGGAVKVGDFLYGAGSESIMCVEFTTGQVKWHGRGVGAGSVCFADGCLYLHGENGEVALVEATPSGYHEKGRFTPAEGPDRGHSAAWTYPVVANSRLYIRDLSSIWCYDVSAAGGQK